MEERRNLGQADGVNSARARRAITAVRAKIAHYLSREMGISLAEFANLGAGTSAIAMAIRKQESDKE
jgi:predicted transcriptional regulator